MSTEEKKCAEQLISHILKIFDLSNSEKESSLVWQVRIISDGKKLTSSVAFSEKRDSFFFFINDYQVRNSEQLKAEMQKINSYKTATREILKYVYEYFAKNISSATYWANKNQAAVIVKLK